MSYKKFDIVIIGGGFYGCMLALYFKTKVNKVAIIEKEKDLLMRASYNNQARVHNGYHYPRSFLTALRSHYNYGRFIKDFNQSINNNFQKIYAIASNLSKTTAWQFVKFCQKIGSPIEEAPTEIKKLFNSTLIDGVFKVEELVFDALKLRKILKEKLKKAGVKLIFNEEVEKIKGKDGSAILAYFKSGKVIFGKQIFNCSYSQINQILKNSNLPLLPFKYEWTEMPLIKIPEKFKDLAITILDGPFFSIMPFPPQKLHTIHHVRYTPHLAWNDNTRAPKLSHKSKFMYMIKDVQRFIPSFSGSQYASSIFEVKTVLEEAEDSDKRPILYRQNYGIDNFHIVMGGKIDNIYDCLAEVKKDVSKN